MAIAMKYAKSVRYATNATASVAAKTAMTAALANIALVAVPCGPIAASLRGRYPSRPRANAFMVAAVIAALSEVAMASKPARVKSSLPFSPIVAFAASSTAFSEAATAESGSTAKTASETET